LLDDNAVLKVRDIRGPVSLGAEEVIHQQIKRFRVGCRRAIVGYASVHRPLDMFCNPVCIHIGVLQGDHGQLVNAAGFDRILLLSVSNTNTVGERDTTGNIRKDTTGWYQCGGFVEDVSRQQGDRICHVLCV